MLENKQIIRKNIQLFLEKFPKKERKSHLATLKMIDYLSNNAFKTVSVFMSFKNEIDTSELINYLFENGYTICVPKIIDKEMVMCKIENTDNLIKNSYGILEPQDSIVIKDIDLIITPLVAFDENLYRVGYGGGYYDKYFKNTNAKKIGFAFSIQQIQKVPAEKFDIKLDGIITEEKMF